MATGTTSLDLDVARSVVATSPAIDVWSRSTTVSPVRGLALAVVKQKLAHASPPSPAHG